MALLDGRVALVTGSARGQGEAIARRFVAEGAKVVVSDILDDQGKAVADSLGADAHYLHLDVAEQDEWRQAVGTTLEKFGKLTTLVNNAAVHVRTTMADMTLAEYQRIIDVNQTGCWLGMKTAAPAIAAAGGGAIVNTSSVAGLKGLPGRSAYGASKWAVRGMTRVAAIELGPSGIRVNSVFPGPIATAMTTDLTGAHTVGQPIARIGSVEEVANLMVFLCSPQSSYCTGAEFVIDGGSIA